MKQNSGQNIAYLAFKFVAVDIIGDIMYWPVWWYGRGMKKLVLYIYREIAGYQEKIGLKLWLSNMFKPMYAQYDWQGRLISFFMRLVILIYKIIKFVVWAILMSMFLVIWALILPFCAYQLITNFYHFIF